MSLRLLSLLFIAIGFTAIVKADSITWTGPATIDQSFCAGCPYGTPTPYVNESTFGPNADLNVGYSTSAWGLGPSASFAVTIPFNVSGDALVALGGTANFGAAGTNCTAVNCVDLGSWNFSGGFDGQVVLDGDGMAFTIPFGGMQTIAAECDPLFGCSAGYMSPGVSITNPLEGTTDLAAGDYTLTVEGSDWDSSVGDSMASMGVTLVLSDPPSEVPEPRVGVLWLVVGCVGMVVRSRLGRQKRLIG
jgi:hypothetical protein